MCSNRRFGKHPSFDWKGVRRKLSLLAVPAQVRKKQCASNHSQVLANARCLCLRPNRRRRPCRLSGEPKEKCELQAYISPINCISKLQRPVLGASVTVYAVHAESRHIDTLSWTDCKQLFIPQTISVCASERALNSANISTPQHCLSGTGAAARVAD